MKTVGEFRKDNAKFIFGDEFICNAGISKDTPVILNDTGITNANNGVCDSWFLSKFAWRENTGVKPEFSGFIDAELSNGEALKSFNKDYLWWNLDAISPILKWRPSLNQPSIAESETKQSAIHKAWVDLKGDISNLLERDERSDIYVSLCIDGMGHGFFAGKYYGTGENPTPSMFEKICTIKEFTDYCEKMAAEKKRMDIIGQNGNDGLHYDNTAQQVEALAMKQPSEKMKVALKEADDISGGFITRCLVFKPADKPIFTQAMADAGELPPVGSLFIDIEYNESKQVLALAHHLGKVVYAADYDDVSQVDYFHADQYCCRPLDTRTDREKAIDEMASVISLRARDGAKEVCGELYDAGYRKC